MSIETAQYPKYKLSDTDDCTVLVQDKLGARWKHYRRYITPKAAGKALMNLSRTRYPKAQGAR